MFGLTFDPLSPPVQNHRMQIPTFSYMRWAKKHSGAHRYDLTPSAVPANKLPPVDQPTRNRQMPVGDGDRVCEALIAARYGVPRDHVLFLPGTTLANYVAAATLIEPGDTVLVESPVYENLPGLVTLFGGEIRYVHRKPELSFRLDLTAVERGFRNGARLLLLTDLHNPTGVHLQDAELADLREFASRFGAHVVIDEVYRDYLGEPVGTAYRPDDPHILTVSSLTKVYGFGALRAGWMFCPPACRETVCHLLDFLTVLPPSPVASAAEIALRAIDGFHAESIAAVARGRTVLERWLQHRDNVSWVPPAGGVAGFLHFRGIDDTDELCEWLMRERDVAVIPGRFFGDPSRIRLAFGIDPAVLEDALTHLDDAIAAVR